MQIPITSAISVCSALNQSQDEHRAAQYVFRQRQGHLLIQLSQTIDSPSHYPLEHERWLVECLRYSPVKLVRIAPELGELRLQFWADICSQAGKAVFLRVPSTLGLSGRGDPLRWWFKRSLDWAIAALLLLALSPLLLTIALLIRIRTSEPIFLQTWCVGERGRLFQMLQFRMLPLGSGKLLTPIDRWLYKYRFEELPRLVNILRGEMSLIGPQPWTLKQAAQTQPRDRRELNVLPGFKLT